MDSIKRQWRSRNAAAAAAAKSLQSCPTLWDPRDGSPTGFPIPGILQARTINYQILYKHWQLILFVSDSKDNMPSAAVNNINHILLLKEVSHGQRKKKEEEGDQESPWIERDRSGYMGPFSTCISSVIMRKLFDNRPVSLFSAEKQLC